MGAAGRACALEAGWSFGDDFGPSHFPCSTETRSGFPPTPHFYIYLFFPKLHLQMKPLFCRAAASQPERFTQACREPWALPVPANHPSKPWGSRFLTPFRHLELLHLQVGH